MGKLLIVDDDKALREAIGEKLKFMSIEYDFAENGKEALDFVDTKKIDLILSDIRMPVMDGIELTKRIKEATNIPIILMTGFSDIIETQEAYNLGVEEFLTKPLNMEELYKLIRKELDSSYRPRSPDDPHGFCKIGIDDFHYGTQIKHSIYIKLSTSKFIKVAHSGQEISEHRLDIYKKKGVNYLYIKRDDFYQYVDFGVNLTKAMKSNRTINKEKKTNLIRHVGEVLQERVYQSDLDDQLFDSSKVFVETVVDVLSDNPDAQNVIDILNQHSDYLFAHSLGVSLNCVMLSRMLSWTLPSNKFKLALAGLYHDIGHKEIDREILEKPRINWNTNELKQYETHSERGYEILSQLSFVPSDVLQVIHQHHENCNGTGFPANKKKNAIHPMARIVHVCDSFCYRTIKGPHLQKPMTPKNAIKDIINTSKEKFDPSFFKALMKLYNIKPSSFDDKKT